MGVAGACLLIKPDLVKVDQTYIVVMKALWPPVLRGAAIAAILAAIMSTTAGMLLATGVEFSGNIVKKFFKPQMTDLQVITLAKVVMAFVGVVTIIMAVNETKSIGFLVALLVGGTSSAFAVPIFAGLWWKRANRWGGFLACVGGFVSYVIAYYVKLTQFMGEILISVPVAAVLMVVGTLVTAGPSKETQEFVDELHQPVARFSPAAQTNLEKMHEDTAAA